MSQPKQQQQQIKNNTDDPKQPKASLFMFVAAISSLLGAIGFGVVIGWSSPAIDSMRSNLSKPHLDIKNARDKEHITWIGSSMTLGALAGALASGFIAQGVGRRKALMIFGIPFTIGWIQLAMARKVGYLIFGRVILGWSVGLLSGTAPTYIFEVSSLKYRGLLGACFQLSITIGIALAYIVGAFMFWVPFTILNMLPTLMMSVCMFFMPETPSWLLMNKNRDLEAWNALRLLRNANDADIQNEFIEFKQEAEKLTKDGESQAGFSWKIFTKRSQFCPLCLAIGLMFFQQFSGINAVMFYSTQILKAAGSSIPEYLGTIMVGVAQVIATFVGAMLIHSYPRKSLLNISGMLQVVSLTVLAFYYWFVPKDHEGRPIMLGGIPCLCLVVFIIGFSIGWGPIPWLMITEITPLASRSLTCAISTMVNWFCAFLVTKNFELLVDNITQQGTYFMFALFSLISILFTAISLPETRNKSSDEISKNFE